MNSAELVNADFRLTVTEPMEQRTNLPGCALFEAQRRTGAFLEWSNLSFRIGEKVILDDLSGSIRPGTLTAVIGPSGSGKSTFMNLLAGRQRCKKVDKKRDDFKSAKVGKKEAIMTGIVKADTVPINLTRFRGNFAFVMQEDAFIPSVTPAEAIKFSAVLRKCPEGKHELEKLVDHTVSALRLDDARNTRIGDALRKGISGGERKRTAIGVELVTNPKVVFLDEPFSGLDSHAAFQTMQVLRRLAGRSNDDRGTLGDLDHFLKRREDMTEDSPAAEGPPILLTVHQPSSMLLSQFDDLIVLIPGGRIIYHGPVRDVASFFLAEYNERCPEGTNPADFVMFLIQVYQVNEPQKLQTMADRWASIARESLRPKMEATIELSAQAHSPTADSPAQPATGFLSQLTALTAREAMETKRQPIAKVIGFFIGAFLAAVYGAVYWRVGDVMDDVAAYRSEAGVEAEFPQSIQKKLAAYYGAMVVLCISTMMGSAQSLLLTFPLQRAIFLREYSSSMYSVPAYFISKTIVELPVGFLNAVGQIIVAYWMMGLRGDFFFLTCVLWLLQTAAASTALMISSAFADPKAASQVMVLINVPQMLFSGLFLTVTLIPSWLRWMQYLSFLKYSINLFYIVEVGERLPDMAVANDIRPGEALLYMGITVAIAVVSRVVAMMALKAKAGYVF